MRFLRKILPLLFAVLLAAPLSGCRGNGSPEETPAPEATDAPAAYSVLHVIRYWPENADYASCDYALVAEMPEFPLTETAGYAMNKAVEAYFDSLAERIETEYMPSSVAKPPHTDVTVSVSKAGDITNVVFSETHDYEAQPYHETHTLMLDARGNEVSLCDWLLDYHAGEHAARAIAELTAGKEGFYEKTPEDIACLIDIRHGAEATENGCRIYVREGLLAPLDEGELGFELSFAELLPELLGENGVFTLDEYRGAVRLLRYVSNSVVIRQDPIENGELTPYTATEFMGQAVTELDVTNSAGRYPVPKAEFEALYRACFGAEFPGIDETAHSIRLEDGVYSVSAKQPEYSYNVDILSAERNGDTVELTGDMIYGEFGYAATEFAFHVAVTIEKSAESPFGWSLKNYRISL